MSTHRVGEEHQHGRGLQINKAEKLFGFQHKALYIDRNTSKVLWKRKI